MEYEESFNSQGSVVNIEIWKDIEGYEGLYQVWQIRFYCEATQRTVPEYGSLYGAADGVLQSARSGDFRTSDGAGV